mmetsp:Transcript_28976/g.40005  ORF Transcript_28976/g.40005 Transcript_28976/m.40005 type:complete len:430 (+) Transcript_28976:136-1425(+)
MNLTVPYPLNLRNNISKNRGTCRTSFTPRIYQRFITKENSKQKNNFCLFSPNCTGSVGFSSSRLTGRRRAALLLSRCSAASGDQATQTASETGGLSPPIKFVINNYLPLGLLLATSAGLCSPTLGRAAAEAGLSTYTTSGIFILSGLALSTKELRRALQCWGAWVYGAVFILLISPLAAVPVLSLPLLPRELVVGLAVFCCMPTTLTSGVALTQTAKGNTALALGLTVGTNVLGILTMPFVLSALLSFTGTGAAAIQPGPLLASLVRTILIPLMVGNSLRRLLPIVANWVDANKKTVSIMTSTLLISVPWMQVSKAQERLAQMNLSSLLWISLIWLAIHTVYLVINYIAAKQLNLGGSLGKDKAEIERAVVLVSSQKTLPVCVAVMQSLGPAVGEVGLCLVPCIVAHMLQIYMDSIIASRWAQSASSDT